MSLATLGGLTVSRARGNLPAWGVPWVDVDLPDPKDAALAGSQILQVGGVSISCTIMSGGASDGRAAYRLAVGRGGWGKRLPAFARTDDAGVKLAAVARAAAEACGEALADVPATRLGPHYVRASALASAVMNSLAPQAWYVELDGVTHFGRRPTVAYKGAGVLTRVDKALGVHEFATEDLVGLLPGVTVDGSLPATDVEFELDAQRLTVRVYAAPRPDATSRRLDAYRRIQESLDPRRAYRGVYEFRVVTQEGERLNLQPVRVASGMPDLPRVPVRLAPGLKARFSLGSLVLVSFVDSDPSRPVVVSGDAADAPGWMPLELDLGSTPQLPIVRLSDPVQAGPFVGVTTGPTVSRFKAGV